MADFTIIAPNILESSTVTVTSQVSGYPKERLWDRDRALRWRATGAATQNITANRGVSVSVDAWALVNHNLAGTVELRRSTDNFLSSNILVDTVNPAGLDAARFPVSSAARYWRVRIVTPPGAPEIGEIVIGTKTRPSLNPSFGPSQEAVVANVGRDESPGGYVWKVRRGAARRRLVYGWRGLPNADWNALKTAFAAVSEGARACVVQDPTGQAWWVEWVRAELERRPVSPELVEVELEFLEAL